MKENLFTPNCIRTFSGQYINVLNPNPDNILIEDIAHSLSMQVRFGGHLKVPYSVAQHSVLTSSMVSNPNHKLQALMHDASEAYLLDFPSPVKKQMPEYYSIENNLMLVIAKKFGFEWPMHDDVEQADKDMLQYEWDNFMIGKSKEVMTRQKAKNSFLTVFKRYL